MLVPDARRIKAWSLTSRSIHKTYLIYCLYLCRVNRQLHWRVVTIGFPRWHRGKEITYHTGIARDLGLKHEFGKSPGVGILVWEIPWTEEDGSLYSPWDHKELYLTKVSASTMFERLFFFFFLNLVSFITSIGITWNSKPQERGNIILCVHTWVCEYKYCE